MLFSKPKWLCHEPDKIKGTHLYSISYHPKEQKLATASSDYYIKIWNTSSLNNTSYGNEEITVNGENKVEKENVKEKEEEKEKEGEKEGEKKGEKEKNENDKNENADYKNDKSENVDNNNDKSESTDNKNDKNVDTNGNKVENIEPKKTDNGDNTNNGSTNSKRLLATLTHHSGPVLCVRFSNISGKYLASASDDKVVLIWQLDDENPPTPPPEPFQNPEQEDPDELHNQENWKVVKRLTGHYMDIVDLSWSPTNSYLATASLDNSIFIYSGSTFELLHKIDVHTGSIKGISFDPQNRYLATSSDDRTTRIFKIDTWEEVIQFKNDQQFNFNAQSVFRRLDWSPDGGHLILPNGISKERKESACLINSITWRPEIWFQGHLRSVAACKYNPYLFKQPDGTYNQIIALGGLDNLISIWKTNLRESIVCLKSVFGSFVTDFSWSPNGMTLVASSFEGTSCCLTFTEEELGVPTTYSDFSGLPKLEDCHLNSNFVSENNANKTVNVLTAFKIGPDGKKRIQLGGGAISTEPITTNSAGNNDNKGIQFGKANAATSVNSLLNKMSNNSIGGLLKDGQPNNEITEQSVGGGISTTNAVSSAAQATQKPSDEAQAQPTASVDPDIQISLKGLIPIPITFKTVKYSPQNNINIAVEIKNQAALKNYSIILCYENGSLIWSDILKSDVILYGANQHYHYLGFKNQELIIFGANGTKLMPPLKLNGVPCFIALEGHYLACLTNNGIIYCWDLLHQLTVVSPSSIANLLLSGAQKAFSFSQRVTNLGVQSMGAPYICLYSGASFIYNISFRVWVTMTDPFYQKLDLNPTNSPDPVYKKVKLPPIKLKSVANSKRKSTIELDSSARKLALTSYLLQAFQASFLWDDEATIMLNFKLYITNLFQTDQYVKILDICKIVFDRQNRVLAPEREIIELGIKLVESIKPIIRTKALEYPLNFLIKLVRDKRMELESMNN